MNQAPLRTKNKSIRGTNLCYKAPFSTLSLATSFSSSLMNCLNLRLPPARKAWKTFTSKIQSKLHKLNKRKAIRKSRNCLKLKTTSTTSRAARPYKFHELRFQRKRCLVQTTKHLRLLHEQRSTFNKYPDPVYVDKLFRGPVSELTEVRFPPKTNNIKRSNDQPAAVPVAGTSKGTGRTLQGDDMWESMGFASPQMHGIDERAEEFITMFRAQMEVQEMLASDL